MLLGDLQLDQLKTLYEKEEKLQKENQQLKQEIAQLKLEVSYHRKKWKEWI